MAAEGQRGQGNNNNPTFAKRLKQKISKFDSPGEVDANHFFPTVALNNFEGSL